MDQHEPKNSAPEDEPKLPAWVEKPRLESDGVSPFGPLEYKTVYEFDFKACEDRMRFQAIADIVSRPTLLCLPWYCSMCLLPRVYALLCVM